MSTVPKRKREEEQASSGGSLLKDEVEFSRMDQEFPRGGGSILAPLDIRRAAADATNDVFDQMMKSKKAKRSKNKSSAVATPASTSIEPFLLSKIRIGTQALGKIIDLKFSTSEWIVSLPNQLVGYCKVEKDLMVTSMLYRYLRFAVVELGEHPRKKLQLSFDPEIVNQTITNSEISEGLAVQGVVSSVEEKGLLLELGTELGQGFVTLKSDMLAKFSSGMPVMAFVTKAENRIKGLTLDKNVAVRAVIAQPVLVPGTLVKSCPIERETSMGCVFDLLGHLKATSDAVHSQNPSGKSVRVLFSYPPLQINGERRIGVSRLEHIVDLCDSATDNVATGKAFEAKIQVVCPNLGVLVQFGKNLSGFVHVSQAAFKSPSSSSKAKEEDQDKKVNLENDDYKVGNTYEARVLHVSQIDGLAYLSFNKDVINQQYMSIQEINIGDIVKNATIDRILPKGGVLVRLSTSIVGIAQDMQLSDIAMKNPEQRYKVGQKVSCRVLDVDLENQRVSVTLKKSVVNFTGRILQSFDFPHNNEETVGTVLRFIDAGALVVFFGNVRGLLPHSEMSESGAKAQDVLRVGQTVRVNVVDSNASLKRLIVSLRPPTQLSSDQIGKVLLGKVNSKNKKETRVSLYNSDDHNTELGEAVVIGKSSKNMKVGDELNVKVLTERLVSADEKIVESDNVPHSVDDIEVGQEVVGYVQGTSEKVGVFVGFAGSITGLISANLLGSDVSKWPAIGSTVTVIVDTIDYAKQRVFLSISSRKVKSTSVTITAIKDTQLNVITEQGQQGRISVSQIFTTLGDIENPMQPLSQFRRGQKLENVAIIGRHDARNHRFLPLSHKGGSMMLELSLVHETPAETSITKNTQHLAFVNNYSPDGQSLYVTLSPTVTAQLSLVDLSDNPDVLASPEEHFPVGSAIVVTILNTGSSYTVTALKEPSGIAMISDVEPLRLMVRLPFHKTAAISCVDSGDEYTELKSTFDVGDLVNYNVRDSKTVTLRSEPFEPVVTGQVRQGFVTNIADGGIFVALTASKIGRVKISEISDQYLKNWKSAVKLGQVVDAKVLSTDNNRIELSLKPTVVTGRKQPKIDHIKTGSNYSGSVVRVESFGVFVEFHGVRGLCHHSEISDHHIDDLNRVFKVGDSVRVKVLSKDAESGKLSLGMKAEYFDDDDDEEANKNNIESGSASGSEESEEEEDEEDNSDSFAFNESESDDEDSSNDEDIMHDSDGAGDSDSDSDSDDSKGGLSAGFNWSGEVPDATKDVSDSDSDSDSDGDAPRTRRKKKREEFVRDETAALHTRAPESAREFERLLVASPGSSVLWTQYMAYQLKLGEVDATREVARRALKEIPQREEEERMNIWLALLNVEVQFGSKESTDKVFKEAQQYMDALSMHLRMAQIYAESGKLQDARSIYERAQKRFGSESLDVWISSMRFLYGAGDDPDAARALADRAQQRLPSRLVRDFTKQFALLEFECGNAERGRTLFEALLDAAPKRVDIWNVYIDQEIKQGDESKFSALFERALQQRISMKQAKFFFKKWIEVSTDQEYVKSRAREYVEDREAQKKEDSSDEE